MTNAVELELLPDLKLRFLERCPDLGGKVDAALAARFKLVKYERDETLYTFDDPPDDRPLRVILLGHVSLVQRRGREQVTRSCGPMSTFGEESVKAWNDARTGAAPPVLETTSAITKSVTHVLELARADFADALGPPGGDDDSLLARLLGAYDVHDIAPELVQTLGRRPELVEVDNEGLYQMLEGAEIRQVEAGEMLAPAGEVPAAFFVLLDRGNSFELRTPGKDAGTYDVSTVPAPACSGIAYVIKGQPLDAAIHVQREGKVVALSDAAFWALFKFNTDFQRAIIRSNDLGVRGRGGAKPRVDPSDASIFLVAPERGLDLPMRALTDLLAESIVTHLYDNVLVIHAVPKPEPGQATTARPRSRSPEVGGPWLEHMWIEIDRSLVHGLLAARARYLAEMDDDHGRPDVTLIEISELHDPAIIVQDFEEIDAPFKVVHLTRQPESVPPIAFIVAGASILYTAILDPAPPSLGVGAAAHLAQAALATKGAASEGMRARIDATMARARHAATFAGRLLRGFDDVRKVALGDLPPAWPLGTVRLRLPDALIAALRSRAGKPPTRLADLGEALAAQTRPTMERWARAVTTRRVGLALGGGGTYGDVHVPFIQALAKENVPIDMVSGSSVGSTIGAYYCGLDLEGLDLYWNHRSQLLAAGSVGFISSVAVEVAMTYDLGQLQLAQTEIPFFPVVTDADVGVESYLSKGTFAFGVRASGSLPPLLGPTVQGDRRYLDGGLVANVPVNVLVAEGAALIIASNPIARLKPLDRKKPFELPFGVFLRESSPIERWRDATRMVPMIFGVAGQSQAANADVTYRPAAAEAGFFKSQEPRFIETALESVLLKKAVAEAMNKWRASLGHPPPRVRIAALPGGGRVLEVQGWVGFVGASATIDPASVPLLVEVADYLVEHPEVLSVHVVVSSVDRAGAVKQAERVKALLEQHGVTPARVAAIGIGVAAPPRVVTAGEPAPPAPEPELTFPVVGYEEVQAEQARLRAALEKARRGMLDAERRADGETLTLAAKDQATSGDLDLAGLLAIEAAKLTRSTRVDEVLRLVLGRRGTMERSITIPATQEARGAAWSPDGALLAVGSRDGLLRIWDARTAQPEPLATIDHSDGTDKAILGVAFSTDGSRIAAAGLDGQASVHQVSRRPDRSLELKPIFRRVVGTWDQWGVALSPDGGRVLVTWRARTDLAIFAADATSSRPLHELEHASNVQQAAWEPNGERIAAAMSDGTAVIWSATTGAVLETIATGERTDVHVAWHPDGGALAVACESTATIHDLGAAPADRSRPIALEGHRRSIVGLAWSDDGSRLVTTSKDLTARIWQARTGAFQMSLRSLRGHLVGAAFRPGNARVIATWDELGGIAVWDAETGEARTTLLGHRGSIKDARWSPDGARLATTSTDATARIWAPEATGQVAYLGHADSRKARVIAAAFSPSGGEEIVTAGIDGSAHAWRASDGQRLAVLASASTDAGPASASFSPTKELVAVTRARVAVPLLFTAGDFRAAVTLATPPAANEAPMVDAQQIRWSPDGSRLAVKRRSTIVVWNAKSGAIERVIAHPRDVVSFCWSPAGDRLALSLWLRGEAVELWDATGGGGARAYLGGFDDGVWSVDWRADADGKQRVATACNQGYARVHDADTGALLASIDHASAVKVVALSPDGRWLATGDDTKTVAIRDWAGAGSALVSGASEHRSRIRQLTWAADGRRLLSVSEEDGVVCIWERRDEDGATSFVNVGSLRSERCCYGVAAWSPDATKIVTGDDEGCALIHPVSQEDLVAAVALRLSRRALTDLEWTRYLPGRSLAPSAAATTPGADPAKG